MVKVVEIKNFNNDDYKQWLVVTRKKDTKKALIEYCATVLGQGKDCWEEMQKGNVELDEIEVTKINDDIEDAKSLQEVMSKITDEEVAGFRTMFKGLAQIVGFKGNDTPLDDIDNDGARMIFAKVMANDGDVLMNIGKNIIKMCEIYESVSRMLDIILGRVKNEDEKDEGVVQ